MRPFRRGAARSGTPQPGAARPLAAIALGVSLGAGAGAAAGADAPPFCEGLVSHDRRVKIAPVRRPPAMARYRDPAFGATVLRITDSAPGEVHKPLYSTIQAWNADESLMLLYQTGGERSGHVLVDGRSYERIAELDILPSDLEEVFWDHDDPDVLRYVDRREPFLGHLVEYDVRGRERRSMKSFEEHCARGEIPTAGSDVQMPSVDDDLFGLRCKDDRGRWIALSYRPSTDEVFTMPIGKGSDWSERLAPGPAPSGERFWMQGTSVTADLSKVEARMDMGKANEHASTGTTHDGEDALFQTVFEASPDGCDGEDPWGGVGHLTAHVLATGECRPVVSPDGGYPYTTSGTHVSALAWKRPGLVAMSSIGDTDRWFLEDRQAPVLFSEIYLVDSDPETGGVCRLAQHRSFGKQATRGGYDPYFAEPHATISPSGTRVLFGSDWYDSGSVDAYVVELPGYDPEA